MFSPPFDPACVSPNAAKWSQAGPAWRRRFSIALMLGVVLGGVGSNALAAAPKKSGGESPFIGQSQISVSIMRALRPAGMMQADVGMLVANPAQRLRAQQLQPVLRNAWRRTAQEFANSYIIPGRAPDAVLLGQQLQAETDQIVGRGVARVLFISLIVR